MIPTNNNQEPIKYIIGLLTSIAGLYAIFSDKIGTDISVIFKTMITIIILIVIVGLIWVLFRDEKFVKLISRTFIIIVLAFFSLFLSAFFYPDICSVCNDFIQNSFNDSTQFESADTSQVESVDTIQVDSTDRSAPVQIESSMPKKHVVTLNGQIYLSRGYWGHRAKHTDFKCHTAVPKDFILIIIRTREESVGNKSRHLCKCPVAPKYCDTAGEECANVYFEKACFINNEWYDWYKSYCEENGLPFSEDAVCVVQ